MWLKEQMLIKPINLINVLFVITITFLNQVLDFSQEYVMDLIINAKDYEF